MLEFNQNPTDAELMAMISCSIKTLQGFDFLLVDSRITGNPREILANILYPLYKNSEDFESEIKYHQKRLDKINEAK